MLLANPDQMVDVTVKYDDRTEIKQIQVGKIAEKAQAITIEGYTFDNAKVGNTLVDTIAYDSTTGSYYVTTSDNQLTGIKLVDTTKVVLTYKKIVESYNIAYDVYVDGKKTTEVSNVIDIVGASTVDEGDNLEFSFNLKKGYGLNDVKVGDDTLSPNDNDVYTIEDVKEHKTVQIYLNKIKTYNFVFKESSNTILTYKGQEYKSEEVATLSYDAFSSSITFDLKAYEQNGLDSAALNKLVLTIDGVQYGINTPGTPNDRTPITTDLGNGISVLLEYIGTTDLDEWDSSAPEYRVTISTSDPNGLHGNIDVSTNYKTMTSSEVWIKQADGVLNNQVYMTQSRSGGSSGGAVYSPDTFKFLDRNADRETRVYFNVAPGYSANTEDINIEVVCDGNSSKYTAQRSYSSDYGFYFNIPANSRNFKPKDIRIMISVKSLDKTYTANYEYGNGQPDKTVGEYSEGNNFLVSDEETEYPEKDGYVFVGWQLGDTVYKPGSLFSITEDTNDFAVFDSKTGKYVFNFEAVWEDADTAERALYTINVYFEDENKGYLNSPTLSLTEYGPNGETAFIIQGELNDKLSTQSDLPVNWQENYELDHEKNGTYSVEITGDGESFINIYYKLKDYSFVTEHVYVNEEGKEIRDTISQSIKAGQTIETEPKQKNGYTLSDAKVTPSNAGAFADDNTFSGVMPKEEVTVTYRYKSIVEKDIGGPIISVTGKDNDERYNQGTVAVNVYVDGVINEANSGSIEYGYWQYAAVDLQLNIIDDNYVLNAINAEQIKATSEPDPISNVLIDNVKDGSIVDIYLSSVYTVEYGWADESSLDDVDITQDTNNYTIPNYPNEIKYVNDDLKSYKTVLTISDLPSKEGYTFNGWYNETETITSPKSIIDTHDKFVALDSSEDFKIELNTDFDVNDQTFVVQHIDEDTDKVIATDDARDTTFGSQIDGVEYKRTDLEGYTFVKAKDLTVGTNNDENIVKVYYSKDTTGPEDPEKGDGIPDKYQITFTYVSAGENGTVTGTTKEVKTIQEITRDKETGEITSVGKVTAQNPTQPSTVKAANGYHFQNWTDSSDPVNSYENDEALKEASFTTSQTFTAHFEADKQTFVVQHIDEDTDKVIATDDARDTTFGSQIDGVEYKRTDLEGYTFVKAKDLTVGTNNDENIVKVYYSKDTTGPEDPEKGDGIPDKYQITFTYVSAGENGTVTGTTKEVKTIQEITRDKETGEITSVGKVTAQNPTQPSTVKAANGYHFQNWTDSSDPVNSYENDEALKEASFTTSQTFTANFKRDFRTINVTPYKGEYDGQEHHVIVNGKLEEDIIEYSVDGGETYLPYDLSGIANVTVKNNGVYNVLVRVTNGDDYHVYESTIEITPKPITLTSGSASKTYDGSTLTNSEVTITSGSLVNASDVTYAATGTITDVGSTDNTVDVKYASELMKANYDVTVQTGTLTVYAQSIDPEDPHDPDPEDPEQPVYMGVDTNSPSNVVYDGAAHQWLPTVTAEDGTVLVLGTDYNVTYSTTDFTNVTGEIVVTITGAGNYAGEITRAYQITPRPVTLTSGSASKTYDGTALTNSEVTITSGSLVNASDVTYAAVGSITNVGSSLNRISVSYASEQMARNYVVTLVEGTLTVNTAPTTPPTTPGTPGTTTDDGATTDEPEVEEVEDEETPLSDGDVEDVEDNATPKGNNGIWALINLIAAIVTVILGLILLLSKRHRNDEEEDEEERQARIERGEEKEQEQKRGWICKVLGVIVAIVSVVFFILTEDMSLPMALTDKWTIWMVVIAIVELVLVLVGRHWKDVDDEDQEQQA